MATCPYVLFYLEVHVFSKMNGPIPEGKELHQGAGGWEVSRGSNVSVIIVIFLCVCY